MKHTPGPWHQVDYHDSLPVKGAPRAIQGPKGKIVAQIAYDISKCRGVRGDWSMYLTHEIAWANADLIAAAPDLLEALRVAEVLITADIIRDDAGCLAKIRKALAKAQGRAA